MKKIKGLILSLFFFGIILSGCGYLDGYKYCKAHPDTCFDEARFKAKEDAVIVKEKVTSFSQPVIEAAINSSGLPGAGLVSKPASTLSAGLLGALAGTVVTPILTVFFGAVLGKRKKKEEEEKNKQ